MPPKETQPSLNWSHYQGHNKDEDHKDQRNEVSTKSQQGDDSSNLEGHLSHPQGTGQILQKRYEVLVLSLEERWANKQESL